MFTHFKPLGNNVWVELIQENQKTAGGLYIPDAAQEKTQKAKVLAVGQGKVTLEGKIIPMQVKVGDIIFFGKFSGTQAGKDHLVLREDDILGIIE